jgi:hypothetical protein
MPPAIIFKQKKTTRKVFHFSSHQQQREMKRDKEAAKFSLSVPAQISSPT